MTTRKELRARFDKETGKHWWNYPTEYRDWLEFRLTLTQQDNNVTLLDKFCRFAEKEGYLDSDWYAEEPKLIDRFMKEISPSITGEPK